MRRRPARAHPACMRILAQLLLVAGLALALLGLAGVAEAFVAAAGVFLAVVLVPWRTRDGRGQRPSVAYRPEPLQRWDDARA